MTQVLEIERLPLGNGFVEWWRLNSPETRNALSDEPGAGLARSRRQSAEGFTAARGGAVR